MPEQSVHGSNELPPKKRVLTRAVVLTAAILGGLFGASVWFSFYGWNLVPNEMDNNGYIAMILGIVFIAALGGGLMALVFWSHRKGYDR